MRKPRALFICERSGTCREAMIARGWDAWSLDVFPSERDGPHIQFRLAVGCPKSAAILADNWDLIGCHPPCTYLALSAVRWLYERAGRKQQMQEALAFVRMLLDAPVEHIYLEQPKSLVSTHVRPKDQTIQPWQFGHGETKETWLWLKNLPKLIPTNIVAGREPKVHRMAKGPHRQRERSRTYQGIADAIATQWGAFIEAHLAAAGNYLARPQDALTP